MTRCWHVVKILFDEELLCMSNATLAWTPEREVTQTTKKQQLPSTSHPGGLLASLKWQQAPKTMTAFSWAYCDKHKPRLRAHKATTPCKYRCRIFKANVVPLLPASLKAKLLAKKRVQESYVNLPHFFGDRGTDVQERPAHFQRYLQMYLVGCNRENKCQSHVKILSTILHFPKLSLTLTMRLLRISNGVVRWVLVGHHRSCLCRLQWIFPEAGYS